MLYLQTIEIILDIVEVRLVRIEQYSGDKTIFYSVIVDGEDETLFEKFLKENIGSFKDELINGLERFPLPVIPSSLLSKSINK